MPDPIKPFTRSQRLNRWAKSIVRWRWLREDGDLTMCNYYRGVGHCMGGCWEEPACQVDTPRRGWPLAEPWLWRFGRRYSVVRRRWRQLWCRHPAGHRTAFWRWDAEAKRMVKRDDIAQCARCWAMVDLTVSPAGEAVSPADR